MFFANINYLTTYKLNGERIDSKTIAIGDCGEGPCFECTELTEIDQQLNLYTANNFIYYDCDEEGEEMSELEKREVIYRKGRLTKDGLIELTAEQKK